MTEMITIIAVGVGLAGLILNGQKNIREDMKSLREDMKSLDARFEKLEMRWVRWSVNRRNWKDCLRDCAKPYQAGHLPTVKS